MMRTIFGLSVFSLVAAPFVMAATGAPAADHTVPTIRVAPEISWSPQRPGEGRLFRVRVSSDEASPVMGVHGEVAGEELHFSRSGGGAFESLAAVPVGAGSAVEGTFRIVYEGGGEERLTRSIPVEGGDYTHEALSVAPRYGSPPSEEDQARLNRDRAMAAEASRTAHRTPRVWTDTVVMPRDGRVTSGFGNGRIFNGQVSSRHMGLDLQGLRGDTVVAATRGVVELVEPFLLAGNIVYLNHGAGLLSAYFHLSEQLVSVGDTVEAGDPVGLVGATGRVTGPHLHWVVRYGRTSVDPRSLIDVLGSSAATR
jgi:hypothetical protein